MCLRALALSVIKVFLITLKNTLIWDFYMTFPVCENSIFNKKRDLQKFDASLYSNDILFTASIKFCT